MRQLLAIIGLLAGGTYLIWFGPPPPPAYKDMRVIEGKVSNVLRARQHLLQKWRRRSVRIEGDMQPYTLPSGAPGDRVWDTLQEGEFVTMRVSTDSSPSIWELRPKHGNGFSYAETVRVSKSERPTTRLIGWLTLAAGAFGLVLRLASGGDARRAR